MRPLVSDSDRRVSICPWSARKLTQLKETEPYDALLASVGYERRSRSITAALGEIPDRAVAVEFRAPQTKTYQDSLRWFKKRDVQVNQEWNEKFLPWLHGWLVEIATSHQEARVAIDISSMNRPRIAAVVQALSEFPVDRRLLVDLLYAPSEFMPPDELPVGVLTLRPVSSFFAGQLRPQPSPVALAGLGYEPHKAAGVFDSLEIRRVIAYVPVGPHPDFHDAVVVANEGLLKGPEEPQQVDYDVLDPFECLMRLDGRVHGLLQAGDVPALVPLGPKIFALNECLVAAMHYPHVSVWRASFDTSETAVPRKDEGWVCGITVALAPALPSTDEIEGTETFPGTKGDG